MANKRSLKTLSSAFFTPFDGLFSSPLTSPSRYFPIVLRTERREIRKNSEQYATRQLLTDDESPPTARLQIQNVSPQIGNSIRALLTPPRLKIELLSSADFNLTVMPRTEIGSATVIYSADQLFLINTSVDAMVISGQIVGWDYVQRVWPAERATQANFPGLFRS